MRKLAVLSSPCPGCGHTYWHAPTCALRIAVNRASTERTTMTVTTHTRAELTPHERDVIALVLREYADTLDVEASRDGVIPVNSEEAAFLRCTNSAMTAEMREIAHKVEWGVG